ncbi:Rieske (2Fe-2S) protein [Mumia sp. zg.B17]|uniref:Rieske (2Fe-2S) protein n=1 Tax=Mumia sp. zg.B17 TaxID=2855446 RepID=UPI001C6E5AC4|nr:Rieske (2Fe-2S) protein [Mumia sp. zg.B17]MBW9205242.1 Rieske (2Fe-2S) protein [Mumia sp. zg.B17]
MSEGTMKRRTVIQGVGVLGGVAVTGGLLAACGGEDAPSGSSTTSAPPAGGATTGGGSAGGTELGATSEVPVGSARFFEGENVLVTQPTEGEFKAFSSVCTHQGCAVSKIDDDLMVCPCHGSEFSIEDGSVERGPAKKPLETREVRVEGDTLFLA